jgi:hypothetical protein
MDEERSEISLLIGYCSRQGGFPMRVGDSSVRDEAGQVHTTRWMLVMAPVGVDTVKTLTHRLRKQYLATVRKQVAGTVSDPAEIEGKIRRALSGVDLRRGPAEIVNT